MTELAQRLQHTLNEQGEAAIHLCSYATVVRVVGLLIEARGARVMLGDICWLQTPYGEIPCEVVGFEFERCFVMPLRPCRGIKAGARLRLSHPAESAFMTPRVTDLLGRVINGLGQPIDGGAQIPRAQHMSAPQTINPMHRHPIDSMLDVGVRSINALLTVGRGQRLGLFAGSGVGKSVLMGMLARMVKADVVVVGLIGERGREVAEFVSDNLGVGLSRAVVVACPADDSAALRLRGAHLATEIAERFRDEGKQVLLLMDSLTRVAQAQREIGLALGEPPSSKGYTPSAFAVLPKLVERAGNGRNADSGSVTAFYTVLMEEDDLQDPVVDSARAILDGHIVLSREIAEQGIYPAVDIGASISRVMNKISPVTTAAAQFKQLWQAYKEQQDLINIGAYRTGADPIVDRAIRLYPEMCDFLRQAEDEQVSLAGGHAELNKLLMEPVSEAT